LSPHRLLLLLTLLPALLTAPATALAAGTADYGAPAVDVNGTPRFDAPTVANTGGGTPAFVDIGAYEFSAP
jgi:hypothetical protein